MTSREPSGDCALLQRLQADMKAALRAGDKGRLGAVRLAIAEVQRAAIDGRRRLDDADVLAILGRMIKQRRAAAEQLRDAGRDDRADQELAEIDVLRAFMPEPLGEREVAALIDRAIRDANAGSPKDIGPVMAALKPALQGRADMRAVAAQVRQRLG